ncbi:hypothetical protein Scep_029962 [Stephania cephalantha]|uniref:Aminotransferase-like plant mobile domain-containing protein n=1 Tax=Stephania cephalantha TaxID=152367 RepID=A0AAP0HGF9_9MAGN
MLTSFPGGPLDLSILPSFRNHVLVDNWNDIKGRGYLKCINHGIQITHWETITHHPKKEMIDMLIDKSGLRRFGYILYNRCNRVIVFGIVERWQPETNTFHLPFEKMTITLDDMWVLLGIPIIGKPVVMKSKYRNEVIAITSRLLGMIK